MIDLLSMFEDEVLEGKEFTVKGKLKDSNGVIYGLGIVVDGKPIGALPKDLSAEFQKDCGNKQVIPVGWYVSKNGYLVNYPKTASTNAITQLVD